MSFELKAENKMKAKEYAERLINSSDKSNELAVIFADFCCEIQDIASARHAVRTSALESIVDEQETKWKSFCRIIKQKLGIQLNENGFRNLLFKLEPNLKTLLSSH